MGFSDGVWMEGRIWNRGEVGTYVWLACLLGDRDGMVL